MDQAGQPVVEQLGPLARRPLLCAALLLIAGILAHRVLPDAAATWIALATLGAVIALFRIRFVATLALGVAIFLAGVAAAQLEHFHFAPDHIATFTTDQPRLAEVELTLTQPPRLLTRQGHAWETSPRQVTQAKVLRVKTWNGWEEASGTVALTIDQPVADLAFGQTVRVLGMLARPTPAMNPGQFDWARYYREQRILANLHVSEAPNVRIIRAADATPATFLNALRRQTRALLVKGFDKDHSLDHALLQALLLGDNDPQLRDIQETFQRTGTSHHLAISGMHVAVLGGVVFLLCRLARLSPRVSAWVMMSFVLLYGVVALPSPPVIRSIILCMSFGIGTVLRRTVDGVHLLALTVFVMLCWHPLDLYNAGFQLSFLTVLGLMLLATPLAHWADRSDPDERALLLSGIAPSHMASLRRWARQRSIAAVAAGAVAWAVSAPLIVEHFDQLNPWAIPASLLLAPSVFAAMVMGLLKILLTALLPFAAPVWAWLAALPVAAMRASVEWLATWPGSDLPLPAVPLIVVGIYYVLLLLPMLPTGRRALRWTMRGGAATACVAMVMLPWLIGFAPRGGSGELRLTLLSVGAGQCAVVTTPGGKTVLIDAGSSTITDLHRKILAPFLRHHGISRLDAIYISHANWDHFSAAIPAAQAYRPREVFITPLFPEHARKNYAARAMLQRLDELKIPIHTSHAGDRITIDEWTTLEVLWPTASADKLDPNNASSVLRLSCRGRSILFTGDIQSVAQQPLLRGTDLRADVLVAPHHGSFEKTTPQLLQAVSPTHILCSNDSTLSNKQKALDTHLANNPPLRTNKQGAITITISKSGALKVSSYLTPQ